jgi:hypothetical protein
LIVLGLNILSILFSNSHNLCFALCLRDHVSHPYKKRTNPFS